MKCLICKSNNADTFLYDIKCFCYSCYWSRNHTYEYLEEVLKNHFKEDETIEDYPVGIKHDESKTNYLQVFNKDFLPTIEECCKILEQGAVKYSQDNWKHLDKSRIEKALLRHLMAYFSGEISDKESGQKHLSHVITNCLFLNWFENECNSNS